jgi:hypothetical protein
MIHKELNMTGKRKSYFCRLFFALRAKITYKESKAHGLHKS